ncbi:MAG: prepilin-type N-terminal cleavage/methylation domain-containing protein [Minisyncoccia bacterium]
MKEQLTINTATQTCDQQIFSKRKSAVNGQMSMVKCSPRGFTLVETLVAIAILIIAVVGPISLIGDALHKLYYAKDQMIAINLAQEGIEAVRQIRDSNMLSGDTWTKDFGNGDCAGPLNCIVDAPAAIPVEKCTGGCGTIVYIDPSDGFYHQYSSPSGVVIPTNFSRQINTSINVDEATVTSTVTWKTGGDSGTVSVSENHFKWAI